MGRSWPGRHSRVQSTIFFRINHPPSPAGRGRRGRRARRQRQTQRSFPPCRRPQTLAAPTDPSQPPEFSWVFCWLSSSL
ncbi:hypothetical protein VPH35_062314 [Triticum aestivum]